MTDPAQSALAMIVGALIVFGVALVMHAMRRRG